MTILLTLYAVVLVVAWLIVGPAYNHLHPRST